MSDRRNQAANPGALMRDIGDRIGKTSPMLARLFTALPVSFADWAAAFIKRLLTENTFFLLFSVAVLYFCYVYPGEYLYVLLKDPPSGPAVYKAVLDTYDMAVSANPSIKDVFPRDFIERPADHIFIAGLIAILLIAVIPGAIKFYVTFFFLLARYALQDSARLFLGRDRAAASTSSTAAPASAAPTAPPEATPPTADAGQQAPQASAAETAASPDAAADASSAAAAAPIRGEVLTNEQVLELAYQETKQRLESVLAELHTREAQNLGIGIFFSGTGAFVLLILLLFGGHPADKSDFVSWFAPKLSVGLFIQIFAYFFLHLYRVTLQDIKYFNNELTNLQLKKLAADMALRVSGRPNQLVSAIFKEFSKTERNFALRRGERPANNAPADIGGNLADLVKEIGHLAKK
jgi:hypothetical protein